jgi:hypothetical protein
MKYFALNRAGIETKLRAVPSLKNSDIQPVLRAW